MRLEHPIFQGPLSVDVEFDPTSEWEKEYDDRGTWLVHEGKFPDIDVGMVSEGYGFEDSPDCERISGGINSKGPQAVAIGRQANMLSWGFYGAPDRMTPSAKRAFLNAIVYMKQFDGHRPLVEGGYRHRTRFQSMVGLMKDLPAMEGKQRESLEKYVRGQLPADLLAEYGLEPAPWEEWYQKNEEYFYRDKKGRLLVDEDLRALELSNRTPAFLSTLFDLWEADHQDEVARRLALRYLPKSIAGGPVQAIAWHAEMGEHLFFSDRGGFRWFVDTNARIQAVRTLEAATPR